MRIVTRLNLIAAGTLGTLLILAPFLLHSLGRFREAKADFILTDLIQDNFIERTSIRDHYLLYREARALATWEQRLAEADGLMRQARVQMRRPGDQRLLDQLERAIGENTVIFHRIVENSPHLRGGEADGSIYAELDKRLISQLLLKATAVREVAAELQEASGRAIDQAFRRLILITGLFGAVLAGLVILSARQISRSITRRLLPLHSGVRRVADGDLEHHLGAEGSDEFAELAGSINTMTDKLRAFTRQAEALSAERARMTARRESEERFRTLLENLTVGVVVHGPDTTILFANSMAGTLLGLSSDQLLGKSAVDPRWCFLREDRSTMSLEEFPVNRVLSTGIGFQGQVGGVCCPDLPEPVWLLSSGFPERDGQGGLTRVVITFSDITERKLALEALDREREMADRYLRVAQVMLVAFDTEARITLLNPKGYAMLGYEEGELEGQNWFSVCLPPEEQGEVMGVYQRIIAGDLAPLEQYENHILCKKGEKRLIAWRNTLVRDEAGRIIGTLSSGEDITEQRRAEEEMRNSEARFRALVENAPEAIVVLDVEKRTFVDLNENACRLFQLSREELLTKGPLDLSPTLQPDGCPSDRRGMDMVRQAVEGGIPRYEWSHLNGLGEEVPCEINLTRLPSSSRILVRGSIIDISERKRMVAQQQRLAAQLQQAQKLDSLGSLAGGVAHDMNNVLGAILSLASAHLEIQAEGSQVRRAFETIVKASTRGRDLVKGLLGFARQSLAEITELDLNALLRDEVRILERTTLSRVRLELDLAEDLRPMRGDASALAHAIMNLCVNAVDAIPDQGALILRTCNVDGDWIEVQVEDTGAGMSREVLDKALDPFFTTKEVGKGTGLGLSLVYSTVKAHQGQMEIQSEPGRGTCVKLRFPAELPGTGPAEAMPEQAGSGQPKRLKVLLVDDDELILGASGPLLEFLGHESSLARSGEEALVLLEGGLCPDVAILDMNMPGLGGMGTLPRLRSLCPDLPVLLATGRVDQMALSLVEQFPHVVLMPKPFSLAELRRHLEVHSQA